MSTLTEKQYAAPEDIELKELIAPDIQSIEEAMQSDISSISSQLDGLLLEVLRYGLFNGGKRFRPLLAVLAARLSGKNGKDVFRLAIAFEYLHMATLFHDDVIDNADIRRGKPAVGRAYGTAAAILAGDFLHARSMALVGELGGVEALKIFCRATSGMVDGEFLQLRNAANFNQSEEDYFAVITGKTVLLIAATTEIGSLYGGGSNSVRQAFYNYGNNLGCAFQIVDDLLDYLGDQRNTGKSIGNDLAEGKMTLPLILAMKRAEQKERRLLCEILLDAGARKRCFSEVRDFIVRYDGFVDAREKAQELVQEAVSELEIFGLPEQRKDRAVLEGLARYVLARKK
jgi:octaprenyl-diphosphate synthase